MIRSGETFCLRRILDELRYTDPLSDLDYKKRGDKMIDQAEASIRKLIPQKKKTTDKEIFIFNHRKGGDKEKISRKWSFRSGYNQAIDDIEKRLG